MSMSVEQRTESSFTVTFNNTDEILTTVTSWATDVEDWLDEIHRVHRRRLSHLIVGLDVEWRPSRTPYRNPVAVLQLCVGRRCLVFQILNADRVPDDLSDFLADERFTFVGVGIDNDVDKLLEDHDLAVGNPVDLRDLAAQIACEDCEGNVKRMGLARLAFDFIGVRVVKPRRITVSRWDDEYLSRDQVGYACVDAFLSFEIGRILIQQDY